MVLINDSWIFVCFYLFAGFDLRWMDVSWIHGPDYLFVGLDVSDYLFAGLNLLGCYILVFSFC